MKKVKIFGVVVLLVVMFILLNGTTEKSVTTKSEVISVELHPGH